MAATTKVLSSMASVTEMANIFQEMGNSFTKDSSKETWRMDTEGKLKLENSSILATLKMGRKMGKEKWIGKMAKLMKEPGKMDYIIEKEHLSQNR